MAATLTTMDFVSDQNRGLLISFLIHGVLLLLMASNLNVFSTKVEPRLAIEAVLIDPDSLQQTTAAPRPVEPEPVPEPAVEPEPEPVAEPEPERVEPEVDRQEMLRVQQEREAAARKEQERQVQAQQEREQKQREAAQREKERKAAEARRAADARRQAELLASMQAEEELVAARQSGELDRYIALITQKVERKWVRPATAQAGLECEVAVTQLPNGDVIDARTERCNGDEAVRRSVERAVRSASPLPLPDNRALFERKLRFIFKPEE